MNAIVLPAGTTHVQFDDLPYLIADALFPDTGPDDGRLRAGYALANIGEELDMDARLGKLLLRNELTFGPHQVPKGEAIVNAMVAVDDLRDYVARRELTVIVEPSEGGSEARDIAATAAPKLKQRAQEDRILELLRSKGHDPLHLPERKPGKRGVKFEIRKLALLERSLFTAKTFDTAWQALRDADHMAGGD